MVQTVTRKRSRAFLIFLALITPFLIGIIYFGNYKNQASAAISYVGIASRANTTASTTITIPRSTSVVAGDFMIAQVAMRPSSPTIAPPSGWTFIRRDNSSTNRITTALYYKFATASEPTSYTWTFSTSLITSGGIVAYRGVDPTTPIDAHSGRVNASGCTLTANSVTTTRANDMLVFIGGFDDDSSDLIAPSGMTERLDVHGGDTSTYFAEQQLGADGSTGNKVTSCSSSTFESVGNLVALSTPTNTPIPTQPVSPTNPPASRLGCTTSGTDYTLIFDRSGSMTSENRMMLAKQAAGNFIDSIATESGARIALISFESVGDETTDLNFSTNFSQAKAVINSYVAHGLTCTRCGLNLARQQFQNNGRSNAKKVVILFTDGEPWHSDSWYNTDEDEKEIQNVITLGKTLWDQDKIHMYGIGLGTAKFETFLPDLVSFSSGKSYQARFGSELNPIYADIVNDVQPKGAISGFVFDDQNRNGTFNSEPRLQGWEAVLTTGTTTTRKTSDASGNYSFTNVCDGNHRVSVTEQPNWVITLPLNPSYYTVSIINGAAVTNQNFGVSQGYIITGNVFNDINKNGINEADEQNYSGIPSLTATRNGVPVGTITTGPGGYYQISGLTAGTVVVSFLKVPEDYSMTSPLNGPPPSFQVTVGPGCNVNGSKGASCQ